MCRLSCDNAEMTTTTKARPTMSDTDVSALLALIRHSDTVELKLTVPESAHRSTATTLGLDPLEAQIRQVFFFDTPDLRLDQAGVVVRARRMQGKADDSTVKLRPVVPEDLPRELRASPAFGVEVDALPGSFVCSGTLRGVPPTGAVQGVEAGEEPLRSLFSKEQRRLFAAHAPDGVSLDDLAVLGPIFVLKLRLRPPALGRRLVAEMWLYPDGSRILELSTKCAPSEAFQVAAESRAFLVDSGIDLTGEQQTKTRKALEFFAARLRGNG
jgi:hypothetical protein